MKKIFIENDNLDAKSNLAFEESLFAEAQARGGEVSFFMLWRNSPSVIVGKYQDIESEIDRDFVEQNNIAVVRRITDGGAVYHDLGNLNYTFIVPYRGQNFSEKIAGSLQSLGLPAVVSGRNDILIEGKKISGHAQLVSKGVLLHHGTLLFDTNLENLSRALTPPPEKFADKAVKSVRERVANIKPFLIEKKIAYEIGYNMENFRTFLKNFDFLTFDF